MARKGAGGDDHRCQTVGVVPVPQPVDPNRAFATRASSNDQFNRRYAARRTASQGAPGKFDFTPPDPEELPRFREVKGFHPVPPDVFVGLVHKLEFEGVTGSASADVETESVGFGNFEGHQFAGHDESAAPAKVKIKAHGLAPQALVLRNLEPGLSGGDGSPARKVFKIIQQFFVHRINP